MSLDDLRIERRADKRTLAADLAAAVADVLVECTDGAGVAHVSLTGGSMGEALLAALPKAADGRPIAWDRVHVWWSDERFVTADDEDRNDRPALPVLRRLGLPNGNVHPMPAQGQVPDLAAAAVAYADELQRWAESLTNGLSEEMPVPAFDLMLLGVGPDGHVASLFPHHRAQAAVGTTTVAVEDSPKPPPSRVSLTFPAIGSARRVWFTVAGADKADAVARAIQGEQNPWECPASAVAGRLETVWWLDDAAAGELTDAG